MLIAQLEKETYEVQFEMSVLLSGTEESHCSRGIPLLLFCS